MHISVQLHSISATMHVVSHFEQLLSDSYGLDVCVVADASKQRPALCILLVKVTSNTAAVQRVLNFRNTFFKQCLHASVCRCEMFKCVRRDVLN